MDRNWATLAIRSLAPVSPTETGTAQKVLVEAEGAGDLSCPDELDISALPTPAKEPAATVVDSLPAPPEHRWTEFCRLLEGRKSRAIHSAHRSDRIQSEMGQSMAGPFALAACYSGYCRP